MRPMAISVLMAAAVALLPVVGAAQGAGPAGTEMEQQRTQRRYVVQPKPDPQAVADDIESATEALVAQRRFDRAVRDSTSSAARRPDLDRDLSGGIQSRNLQGLRLQLPLR